MSIEQDIENSLRHSLGNTYMPDGKTLHGLIPEKVIKYLVEKHTKDLLERLDTNLAGFFDLYGVDSYIQVKRDFADENCIKLYTIDVLESKTNAK